MVNRTCLDCGALTTGARCAPCRSTRNRNRDARRGNRHQRGYGWHYQQQRDHVVATATHCATCGEPFAEDNPATGGHVEDLRNLPPQERKASAATAEIEPQCQSCNYGWRRGATSRRA